MREKWQSCAVLSWNVKLINKEYAKGLQYKYLKCVRYFTQDNAIKKRCALMKQFESDCKALWCVM